MICKTSASKFALNDVYGSLLYESSCLSKGLQAVPEFVDPPEVALNSGNFLGCQTFQWGHETADLLLALAQATIQLLLQLDSNILHMHILAFSCRPTTHAGSPHLQEANGAYVGEGRGGRRLVGATCSAAGGLYWLAAMPLMFHPGRSPRA